MSRVWQRNEPDSPCVGICTIHPATKLCLGCARSTREIAAWPAMNAADRAAVMSELPARSPAPGRRGGRRRLKPER
ncbi:MAG: DUF1289 domain-containing protein [Pseudomonadota bacterium]